MSGVPVAIFVTLGLFSPASATTVPQLRGVSAALEAQIIPFGDPGWSAESPVASDSSAAWLRSEFENGIAVPAKVIEVASRSWRKTGGGSFAIGLVELRSSNGALEDLDQRLLATVEHGQSSICGNGAAVRVIASLVVPNSYYARCLMTPSQGPRLIYWIKDHELALMYTRQGSISPTEFQTLAQLQYNAMGSSGSPATLLVAATTLVVLLGVIGLLSRRRGPVEPLTEIAAPHKPQQLPVAGWYGDPEGGPEPRFWDGTAWSAPGESIESKSDAPPSLH